MTCHWPQPHILSHWPHSSFSVFLFILDLYSPPFLLISFLLPDSLPILTPILTPLAVSFLCHQVPASRCLPWPQPCSRTDDVYLGEYIYCSTQKISHRDFRHYWHGLTFITVEESQKCIKEVCFQSSYPLILVNGCGCVENFVS